MKARDYMEQARYLDNQIDAKIRQLDRLNDLATKATASITGMPKAPVCEGSALESTVVKIIDLQNEINADIDRLVDLKREVMDVIGQLEDPKERLVLEKRYLCYESWEQIAADMHYSVQNAFKIHDAALEKIEKVI